MTQVTNPVEFCLHIGAHRTATQHLQKVLQNNKGMLAEQGVIIADPQTAEEALVAAITQANRTSEENKTLQTFSDTLSDGKPCKRIVMSTTSLLGPATDSLGGPTLYPRVLRLLPKMPSFNALMNTKVFLSVRNPASFVPSSYNVAVQDGRRGSFEEFQGKVKYRELRWSQFVHRIQHRSGCKTVVAWRFEDYPSIWRDVVQMLTGIKNKEDLEGTTEPVNKGMSLRGAQLMVRYLEENPAEKVKNLSQIAAAFIERFPSSGQAETSRLWSSGQIEDLTYRYDDDWYYIERMENVLTIQPRDLNLETK